mmetsp:Transcript_11703/g.33343  ORF Transcript_11703/g.33343 Transcript_11703/m.33343 type:complete len:277 (+) Transcript_11703:208-1038(+)
MCCCTLRMDVQRIKHRIVHGGGGCCGGGSIIGIGIGMQLNVLLTWLDGGTEDTQLGGSGSGGIVGCKVEEHVMALRFRLRLMSVLGRGLDDDILGLAGALPLSLNVDVGTEHIIEHARKGGGTHGLALGCHVGRSGIAGVGAAVRCVNDKERRRCGRSRRSLLLSQPRLLRLGRSGLANNPIESGQHGGAAWRWLILLLICRTGVVVVLVHPVHIRGNLVHGRPWPCADFGDREGSASPSRVGSWHRDWAAMVVVSREGKVRKQIAVHTSATLILQ